MGLRGAPLLRREEAVVWTGTEVLVWGGFESRIGRPWSGLVATGARFHPGRNRWRTMATRGAPSPRRFPVVVWTGHELLVWGGACGERDGALYDPVTDRWRSIPVAGAPDGPREPHVLPHALVVGDLVLLWTGSWPLPEVMPHGEARTAVLDPGGPSWGSLEPFPLARRESPGVALDSGRLLVWGGRSPGGESLADGAAWDPAARAWSALDPGAAPPALPSPPWPDGRRPWSHPYRFTPVLGPSFEPLGPHFPAWTVSPLTDERLRPLGFMGGRLLVSAGTVGDVRRVAEDGTLTPGPEILDRKVRDVRAVWTGEALIVWGGWSRDADGARTHHHLGLVWSPD